jgi:hypothetical protein
MTHQAPCGRHNQQTLGQPPHDNDPQGPYPPQGHSVPPSSGYQQARGPQYASAPPHRQKRRRRYTLLGLGGLMGPIIVIAAGCSSSGASAVNVNGMVNPSSSSGVATVFGAGINATTYAGCAKARPAPGTQITVTDPSGKVIGTGTLGRWLDTTVTAHGLKVYQCNMPFTISNVPSEQRYGFLIKGVPGTMWEASVSGPVHLSVSGG